MRKYSSVAVFALVLSVAPAVMASPECAASGKVPNSARTFARIDDESSWREFRNVQEAPAVETDGGMSARIWKDKNKSRTVYIIQPGQDFWIYARYCFSSDGELKSAGIEVRTALGWGHRTQCIVSGAELEISRSEFFDLKDGKPIPKPAGVRDVPGALRPAVYLEQSQLRFAKLLDVSAIPAAKISAKGAAVASVDR